MTWIGGDAEPAGLLREVARRLSAVYERPAAVTDTPARPSEAFDPRRGQHSSTAVLHWLQGRADEGMKLLAVTDADLFIPVLTFVYGEAQLGGQAAVVSLARLGDRSRPPLTLARLAKEAVHEVGHLFGLVHCGHPRCAMRRSAAVHDVDGKEAALCADCRMRLAEARSDGSEEP